MREFLHEHAEFKTLIDITAQSLGIQDPALVEKDYWLMHVLWGLQQLKMSFHLKGGTSLSKGYHCIHRFSEDIDVKIEPDEKTCGFKVFSGKNHDDLKHRESRAKFFDWITLYLRGKIPGIVEVIRDTQFDDAQKLRNGGVRLLYSSRFSAQGLKDGILFELGFDRTVPNRPCLITSWAYDRAVNTKGVLITDNRAHDVLCYEPKFTFVEKLQAVVRKFRLFKEGKAGANLPANFIRHYYDLFQLIDRADVQGFIGTTEYEDFKNERFGGDDTKVANSDALKLTDPSDRALFEMEFSRTASLYFKGRPTLDEMLQRIAKDIDRL
ncbi:MAG: nucleotidyl transferase AbiEii/AbiGii toxin family protein [Bdellovibrionales bacterium]|nr:nucleotidyl transferase AbiEii/AbiGii toxin family protein [Bdellovibrionales bacterium]